MMAYSELIRPLKYVENQFLQVLLTRFSLKRDGAGVELRLECGDDTPTISTRLGKSRIRKGISDFEKKSDDYQKLFDSILIRGTKKTPLKYHDKGFPFRYASGGTLPIVRLDGRDYYCLFYRDISPIGWNIANGGCCTREELLDPTQTIRRELREELVIVDRSKRTQYVIPGGERALLSRPHLAAQGGWTEIFKELAHYSFKEADLPVKWLEGPDRVEVRVEDEHSEVRGCFLNINAADFGIEIDKVAKIAVNRNVVICDGEQTGNFVLGRMVGLFEVEKTDRLVTSGSRRFLPSRLFFNGKSKPPKSLETVVNRRLIPRLKGVRSREEKRHFAGCKFKYDLCPVTRSILRRYATRVREETKHGEKAKVFISYGGDDEQLARDVFEFLGDRVNTFFFSMHQYRDKLSRTIDDALDSANTCHPSSAIM